jgi:hypothetical protein
MEPDLDRRQRDPRLFIGDPVGNYVWGAVAWSLGIAAVFAVLSVAKYKRAVVR